MKKESQELYLQYCDTMTGILLDKKNVNVEVKVSQVLNYGKEVSDFLKDRGFNESSVLSAKRYVDHTGNMLRRLKPEKNQVLRGFLANLALCEHGAGITMMTGLMLDALGFKDEKVINTLALSGFLHDIGLLNMPSKFLDENEEELNDEERKLFITHPVVGYEMTRAIRTINPIIPATILGHHERRTGQGFPNGIGAGGISTITEVIGIVDIFLNLLKLAAKQSDIDVAEHMQKVAYDQFSFNVIEAFDKTFMNGMLHS